MFLGKWMCSNELVKKTFEGVCIHERYLVYMSGLYRIPSHMSLSDFNFLFSIDH